MLHDLNFGPTEVRIVKNSKAWLHDVKLQYSMQARLAIRIVPLLSGSISGRHAQSELLHSGVFIVSRTLPHTSEEH